MAGLAHRAVYLTLARFANYGLMLVSPIILVRVLSVEEFGRYREFLLYAALLQTIGGFAIYDSLLYFIPAHPESPWRIVRQTTALAFCSTSAVAIALVLIDLVSGGAVVGQYLWPLVLFLMLSMNVDFWEFFWLANHQSGAMFMYSAGRLALRLIVVVAAASLTHDVASIIWSLIALEGARLIASLIALKVLDRSATEQQLAEPWRAQLRFCLPSGAGSLLAVLNRNLSSVVIAKALGAVPLAHYAIGRFGEPIVTVVRNSVSTVVLPEMVRRGRTSRQTPMALWQHATAVNAIFLLPIAVLVARYAEPLISTVFGGSYVAAATVMQIYMLVLVRECFDFAPALRAINRASPLVYSNLAALLVGMIALLILMPRWGINGAMAASVIASFVDAAWLGYSVAKYQNLTFRQLAPWRSIGRTALAAALAAVVIVPAEWTEVLGLGGIVLACATYLAVFAALLGLLRVPEAARLFQSVRRTVMGGSSA